MSELPDDQAIKGLFEECQMLLDPEYVKFLSNLHKSLRVITSNSGDGIKELEHLVNEVQSVSDKFRGDLEAVFVKICSHYYHKDTKLFEHYLKKAVNLVGLRNPALLQLQGLKLLQHGQNEKALEVFQVLKESGKLNVDYNLAYSHFQLGQHLKAWEIMRERFDFLTNDIKTDINVINTNFDMLTKCFSVLKNHEEVILLTTKLIEKKLASYKVYYLRGLALEGLKQYQ